MDQTSLSPPIINTKLAALAIESAGDKQQSMVSPLLRQPGYSTKNLELLELLSKPVYLPSFTVDPTFNDWFFPITPSTVLQNPWVAHLMSNFMSPVFDANLTLVVPGHQFAVGLFGVAYVPNMVGDNAIFYPDSTTTFQLIGGGINTTTAYNRIVALNGTIFSLTESAKTICTKSSTPSNFPMNPLALANPALPLGGFWFRRISPLNFGMSLTSFTVRPILNLTNVALMPWRL